MATEYVNSSLDHSRPTSTGSQVSSTSGSTPSSATSSGSHRNRQLLKSYHDFAMHVFSNNKVTQESERLFLSAVREGDYRRVENFLKRRNHEGVNIDMKDFGSGDTPLIAACRNGHTKIVQLLLRFGADVTLRNYECETAVSVSSAAIRKMLLESVERSGCSHRHLLQAAWQGNIAVVQQLLKEGKFLDVNCENEDGFTPLLLVTRDIKAFEKLQAVLKSYKPVEVVRVLLGQRADPSTTDSEGKTPLHHAAASSSSLAHQITLLLMKDKENLVAQDENSVAPIHVASQYGQVEILVALLDNGVDINSRGQAGATPLHVSASAGQLQVTHTLLDRGADVTLVDDRGNTPMDVANNRKMRATLKEAWTDATQARRGSTPVLSPVKPPSRRDHRRHSSSDDISPRDTDAPVSLTTNRVLQKLKDAHQALLSEGQLYRDIDNGNFTPSGLTSSTRTNLQGHPAQRRSISPSKAPMPPKTPRGVNQRMTDGDPPSSQVVRKRRSSSMEDRPVSSKLKGEGTRKGHPKLGYRHSDPTGSRQAERASIPVTVVGLDWDESVQDIRFSRLQQGNIFPSRDSQPSSGNEVPKRLTLDLACNPSLQQVTDACSSYIRTRGSSLLHPQEADSQPSLPAVSPSRPLSGSQRPNFFDGNHVSRMTNSPFMERLHGFLGPDQSAQSDKMQQEAIYDIDCEESRTGKEEPSHEAPLSPLRSALPSNSFRRLDLSHYPSRETLQMISPFAVATTTFNIEMSRVNQLKDSSDSGQGSSRSTNSRASTISTPSPLLGETDGSLSRLQGVGTKRGLYLQSIDGDSGIHLPSLPRDSMRRLDRVQALEERNFRALSSSNRHNSEDTMSIVSVSSSVTVKTADICGQRISLSHTLKEESEASSSPEQTLRDPAKVSDALKGVTGSKKDSQSIRVTENLSHFENQKEELLASKSAVVKKDSNISSSGGITSTAGGNNTENSGMKVQAVSGEVETVKNSIGTRESKEKENECETQKEETKMVNVKKNLAPKEAESGNKLEVLNSREQVSKLASFSPPKENPKFVNKTKATGSQVEKNASDKIENGALDRSKRGLNQANKQKDDKVKGKVSRTVRPVKHIQYTMEDLPLENKESKPIPATTKSHGAISETSLEKDKVSGKVDGKLSEHSMKDAGKMELMATISKDSAKCKGTLLKDEKEASIMTKTRTGASEVAPERKETDVNRQFQSKAVTKEGKNHGGVVETKDPVKDKSAIKKAVGKKTETELPAKVNAERRSVKSKQPNILQGTKEIGSMSNRRSRTLQGTNSIARRNQQLKEKGLSKSGNMNNVSSMNWIEDFSSVGTKHVEGDGKPSTKNVVTPETERKADSGRSQGTLSTPTDVTSDLTSDLYSGDSDSLESIEEVLDEVAFSSSSGSDLQDGQKKDGSGKTPEHKLSETSTTLFEDKKPKAALMVLDPAVVLTKSEKKEPQEKVAKLSPKSPRTPKSGAATGIRKFTFKPVESKKGKKRVVKVNPGKTSGLSKGSGSKTSPVISKKSDHMPKSGQAGTREGASESKVADHKADKQDLRDEDIEGENKILDAQEENSVKIASHKSHHTPVIIDIRDDLPECQQEGWKDGRITSGETRVLSHPAVNQNRKKSALQQLGRKFSKGSGKTGGLVEKGSSRGKLVDSSKSGNGKVMGYSSKETKSGKDASSKSPKVTPKKGKGKKIGKEDNLRIMSESESKNTAFITGKGWEIKTSRNEIDGVIMQKEKSGASDVSTISQRKLSPANSLKMDFIAKNLPMSPDVIKNIANIMSPLEVDTPKFIPDTMDTIKEFAGSLSSVEEEKTRAIFTFSPVGSPKTTRTKKGKISSGVSEGKNSPKKATPSPMADTPGSAFFSPTVADTEECDTSDLKTNPEFLKVFKVPDHCDSDESTPRNQLPGQRDVPNEPPAADPDHSLPSKEVLIDIPDGVKDALKLKRKSINVMQKPLLPKFGLTKSQRKLLKRRQSAPSELPSSDEELSDVDSLASSFRRRFLADIPDAASEEGSADECNRSEGKQGTGKTKEKSKSGRKQEEEETMDAPSSKEKSSVDSGKVVPEDLNSSSKEQLLNEHVQTISIKTLQELNTILSNSEEVNVTSPLAVPARPISRESMVSIKTQTTHSLNQSLPMSESSVGIEISDLDNLRPDSHLSGEILNTGRGTCLSSATSGDRSHSQSTNLSESEGELLHWKKGNVLGKGAFGTVYCGLTSTGQLIAVKQVGLTGKHQAGEQYEKLQEEIELLKTLRHKNIVGFLGVSLEESVVNIFMQYIPGGSIASLLARFGALEEPVFCRYTKQITDGMVYLHSNSVIHRDIKGANIMLMSNGVIKLIDFGCAKRLCIQLSQSQNLLKSMKGTPYWMAPEVIMETGHGAKSDVWSVGCTVMEMATRKPPWADMPPMSAIFAIGAGGPVPQLDEKFSPDARNFVSLCLTRNPDERATSLELLQHPFLKNRKERRKDSRLNSRSSLSNFEEGIMFKEQPILKETIEKPRKRRIFEDFE